MNTAAAASCSWTSGQDAILVATLKTAKADGLQADKWWRPEVWEKTVTALEGTEIEDGGIPKTVYQVKTRYQKLKSDYRIVKQMRDTSGIQRHSHPNAKPFRKKKFSEDLADIISGGERLFAPFHVTTEGSVTSVEPSTNTNVNDGDESNATNTEKAHDESQETAGSTEHNTSLNQLPKEQHTVASRSADVPNLVQLPFSLNEVVESVVHTINDTSGQGPGSHVPLTSLQLRAAASRAIEQEEGLSDEDMVNIAEMIREGERTDIADVYLALTKKATRTAYLRKQLDKYLSK